MKTHADAAGNDHLRWGEPNTLIRVRKRGLIGGLKMADQTSSKSGSTRHIEPDQTIAFGERWLASAGDRPLGPEVVELVSNLISIYDAPFGCSGGLRRRASELVTALASRNLEALNLVIQSAREYLRLQHIDDADPYSPNSLEVLGQIHCSDDELIHRLGEVVGTDQGLLRQAAIGALGALRDSRAGEVFESIS